MDSQVENAIEIAWNPMADQALKSQAFQFLEQLRSDPQGWSVSFGLFSRTPRVSEVVRLVCLEIVNHAINSHTLDRSGLVYLRDATLEYTRRTYGGGTSEQPDPVHLQNKLTQTMTYLFLELYAEGWETCLGDFLGLTYQPNSSRCDNPTGVSLYLRMLGAIHDEIADVLVNRQGPDGKRNADLKDLIRQRDMGKIARSWHEILSEYCDRNDAIVEMTLKVIGKWVSWIDISLVINQEMLNRLLLLAGRMKSDGGEDRVRDAAIDTFTEVVAKKMQPADKTEMISFLNLREIVSQLVASPPLNDFQGTAKYDHELAEAVAKLVNTIMADIIRIMEDQKVENDTRAKAEQQLQGFFPFLLRFFSDEYDEICSTVIPSLTDLLTFLRKIGNLPPAYSEMIPPILNAIIMKMRYDDTTSWGNESEQTDEAEFHDLRKRLQILQKSVAAVDQNLYMEILSNLVANTFASLDQQGSQMDWRDLDLALHEISLFGELSVANSGLTQKSQPDTVAAERLVVMMKKMVESGIANHPHPAILLQYLEIVVRYCSFFESNQNYIPQVLENFVRLVHHTHVRIQTRSWYLFMRFIKHLRAQVGNVAETVIQSIGDLLPIRAEVPGNDADDDMSSDETDRSAEAVFISQLYLFEAIGCISSTSNTTPENQALYARSVMQPLFADMETHLPRAKAGDQQAILQIHHIVMALGTLANGFSTDRGPGTAKPTPSKPVQEAFARAAEAILVALSELSTSADVRAACRSAFSRLLGVLGNAVLPQLPQWIEGLLSRSSSKDEMAMFLRLLEQVVHSFKSEIYNFLDVLLTPLLERVLIGLSEPISGTDDEIQLQELRREYLAFIQVILNNDLGGVLISATNQQFFETLINSIITLSKTIGHGNIGASRLGFSVLGKMAAQWGGPDIKNVVALQTPPPGANKSKTSASGTTTPAMTPTTGPGIPGFGQFMIERFHTACWEVLQDPNFKTGDAQSKQVLNEIAGVEQVIYAKTGDALLPHLAPLGIDVPTFVGHLAGDDRRTFTNYLAGLVRNRRT